MDQLTGITWTDRPASRGTSDRDAWNTHERSDAGVFFDIAALQYADVESVVLAFGRE